MVTGVALGDILLTAKPRTGPSVAVAVGAKVVSAVAIAAFPWVFWGHYAGDAEIHLVYAANAAAGRFFEFNPGEVSPGVTSPGWMLGLAALFRALPDPSVPLAVKLISVAGWYAGIALVFVLARRLVGGGVWPWVAAGVAGLLPGSAYNATIGMENGLFALVVLGWVYLALRWEWFAAAGRVRWGQELRLGALLGAACWLRPEGFVLTAVALGVRVAAQWRRIGLRAAVRQSVMAAAAAGALGGAMLGFHGSQTGFLLPASGAARRLMAMGGAPGMGPFVLDPKLGLRLAAYLPLTAFGIAGLWGVLRRRPATDRAVWGFIAATLGTFFVLYTAVLGCFHTARYTIFLMPLLVLAATSAARRLWTNEQAGRSAKRAVSAVSLLWLGSVFSVEACVRHGLGAPDELHRAMQAPLRRAAISDTMIEHLGRPVERPIVLACQEVQIRWWLDERFVVRSLDGRTDPRLLDYVRDGRYDHLGYLRGRDVRFVTELRNYNHDPTAWSLQRLSPLQPGQSVRVGDLQFTRLGADQTFRVDHVTAWHAP